MHVHISEQPRDAFDVRFSKGTSSLFPLLSFFPSSYFFSSFFLTGDRQANDEGVKRKEKQTKTKRHHAEVRGGEKRGWIKKPKQTKTNQPPQVSHIYFCSLFCNHPLPTTVLNVSGSCPSHACQQPNVFAEKQWCGDHPHPVWPCGSSSSGTAWRDGRPWCGPRRPGHRPRGG